MSEYLENPLFNDQIIHFDGATPNINFQYKWDTELDQWVPHTGESVSVGDITIGDIDLSDSQTHTLLTSLTQQQQTHHEALLSSVDGLEGALDGVEGSLTNLETLTEHTHTMLNANHTHLQAVKTAVGSPACNYLAFGHSAGSQFLHRLLTFRSPSALFRSLLYGAEISRFQ